MRGNGVEKGTGKKAGNEGGTKAGNEGGTKAGNEGGNDAGTKAGNEGGNDAGTKAKVAKRAKFLSLFFIFKLINIFSLPSC